MSINNYTNGYQATPVSPYYSQQQSFNQLNTSSVNNAVIWVQGLEAAKSYLVAPNSTVYLWDSEGPVIYVKSADASGIPNIRIIDYKYREGDSTTELKKEYVTQSDFNKFKKEIMNKLKENTYE